MESRVFWNIINNFGIFIIPLMIYILYKIVTELLDLLINTSKLNQLLTFSDNLNIENLESEYNSHRKKLELCNKSNLSEMVRQVNYDRMENRNLGFTFTNNEKYDIKLSKDLTEFFKVK